MDIPLLLVVLALGTIAIVVVFALVSKFKTEKVMNDDTAPKSSLAEDAPKR